MMRQLTFILVLVGGSTRLWVQRPATIGHRYQPKTMLGLTRSQKAPRLSLLGP